MRFIFSKLKNFLGFNVRKTFFPGFSLGNYNFYKTRSFKGYSKYCERVIDVLCSGCYLTDKSTGIDVGCGDGRHGKIFSSHGVSMTYVDYGLSVNFDRSSLNDDQLFIGDFVSLSFENKFQFVWCSHVLEHQKNAAQFIEKLIEVCENNGLLAITVPDPHRVMAGGHLSLWTPGLLLYHLVVSGLNCVDAEVIYGWNEFTILVKKRPITDDIELSYDRGDLLLLSNYFPNWLYEGSDSWK